MRQRCLTILPLLATNAVWIVLTVTLMFLRRDGGKEAALSLSAVTGKVA